MLSCLIVALASATGCESWFGEDGKAAIVIDDAGQCVKDREVLSEILVQPVACTTSDECPGGAFCDTGAGQCDWQCFTDSDCGFGYTCSCDGVCLAGGVGQDAGPAPDPSCPRDEALLTATTRTNLIPYSSAFRNWNGGGSTNPNVVAAPDGSMTADEFVNREPPFTIRAPIAGLAPTEHTFSIYVRSKSGTDVGSELSVRVSPSGDVLFVQPVTATAEWQRFSLSFTPATTATLDMRLRAGAGGEDLYIWGAQLEPGPLSEYIPTTGEPRSITERPIDSRTCILDEHCPLGSRCSPVTRYCIADCVANEECGADEVCDCTGTCVVPGADPEPRPVLRPLTTVEPGYLSVLPGDNWGLQTLSVRVETSEGALPDGTEVRAYVEALDGNGLHLLGLAPSELPGETVRRIGGVSFSTSEELVAFQWLTSTATQTSFVSALSMTDAQAAEVMSLRDAFESLDDFAALTFVDTNVMHVVRAVGTSHDQPECTGPMILAGADWVVDPAAEGYAATASVSVGRCAPGPDDAERLVAVSTYLVDAADPDKLVAHLDYRVVGIGVAGALPPATTTATGEFEGHVVVSGGAAGEALVVPVKAWATNATALVLIDELGVLSASGRIELTPAAGYLPVIDPAGDGSRGQMSAETSGWTESVTEYGDRSGEFELVMGASPDVVLRAAYQLRRTGDPEHALSGADSDLALAAACSTDADCPAHHVCLSTLDGHCGPDLGAPSAAELHNTIEHRDEAQWRAAASFLDEANDVYDPISDAPFPPMLTGERLLCHDYPELADWADEPTDARPLGRSSLTTAARQFLSDALGREYYVDPVAGDLHCQLYDGGGLGEVSFTQTAIPVSSGGRASTGAEHPLVLGDGGAYWLGACIDDLMQQVPDVRGESLVGRTTAWFGAARPCINLAQAIPALASFAHGDIAGDGETKLGARAAGLFQRVLSQWLDVHALVALQGRQERATAAHLSPDDAPIMSGVEFSGADTAELLELVDRGWELVFDPTYAAATASLTRSQLRSPDYRIPAPSAYWSFDSAHTDVVSPFPPPDVPGPTLRVADLVGDNHLVVPGMTQFANHGRFASDGAGYVASARGFIAPHTDVTVSFWLDVDSVNGPAVIYSGPGLKLFLSDTTGGLIVSAQHGASFAVATLALPDAWAHIAVVRVNGAYRFHVNGNLEPAAVSSFSSRASYDPEAPVTMLFGSAGLEIDELAIWEHSLDERDILNIFERGRGDLGDSRLAPLSGLWSAGAPEFVGDNPNHDQGVGLATTILATAVNHAELVRSYADEQLAAVYGACYAGGTSQTQRAALARAARSLRWVSAADALAADLYRRSREVPCEYQVECSLAGANTCGAEGYCVSATGERFVAEPDWADGYANAATLLGSARARAVDAIGRLRRCENPLGISEDDLPLYFGDLAGDNARFFASSDYLLDVWARPALSSAIGALGEARSAWLQKRDSEFRQLLNEFDAERRQESLEESMVAPIVDACGLTDMPALEVLNAFNAPGSELTVNNCFRRADCDGNTRSCVRGALGSAVLSVVAAKAALFVERRQQERREEDWKAQVASCKRDSRLIADDLQALADYAAAAEKARTKSKGVFGAIGAGLDDALGTSVFEDITEIVGGCFTGSLSSGANVNKPGALGCVAGIDSTFAQQGLRDLDEARDALNEAHAISQLLREKYACWDQVRRAERDVRFGVDFARQQIAALEQARFQLDELLRSTARRVTEATATLEREQGRTLPSVAHHYWTDEKVDRFESEFERARRLTFLAMRAVEYEFQQSLGLRSAILSAGHPYELERIVLELDTERGARSINARRPAEGTEVLSLRSDILEIGDMVAAAPGERTDDATRRFQSLITSPEYAVWDAEGNYLGQGITFNVAEQGALRHRCAERLWRVNATIQGDLTEVEEPGTHVFLLKNNVFMSQWCEGLEGDTEYQQASTNHATNLLRGDSEPGDAARLQHATAILYPWFNVRRSDFYRDAYVEGASEELAGRGLYGEYTLLFPYHGMLEPSSRCDPTTDAACADFFRDLARVEDVLIRFDYYSVDNLTSPF